MIQFEHVSFGYPEHGGAVEDVSFTVSGRQFSFFCRVLTEEGCGDVFYSLEI